MKTFFHTKLISSTPSNLAEIQITLYKNTLNPLNRARRKS